MNIDIIAHWQKINSLNGKYLRSMELTGVPPGWVVNGNFPIHLGLKINTNAIPLKIGGWNLLGIVKATIHKFKFERKYGHLCMLMIPHEDTESGWFARFVIVSDFEKDTETIRAELSNLVIGRDSCLRDMKECLWLAMTGLSDPE